MFYKNNLALDYHINTKSNSGLRDYDPQVYYKAYPNTKVLHLSKNNAKTNAKNDDIFLQTLMSRKSTRAFASRGLELDALSKLLTLGCGLKTESSDSIFRTYASAGGRYPIEIYVAILQPSDIEQGIYHFNIKDNSLEMLRRGDYSEKLGKYYTNQPFGSIIPCLIFFSMVFERTMGKYGERGYRYALIDAGHMGQNLYLCASYLNLGIVGLGQGAVSDVEFEDFLGLNSAEESMIYSFAVGYIPDIA